jgi:hypothetical protein
MKIINKTSSRLVDFDNLGLAHDISENKTTHQWPPDGAIHFDPQSFWIDPRVEG